MGHCVGGYCDEVAQRGTKIYSLRDKNNNPHVTVEVHRGRLLVSPEDLLQKFPELKQYKDTVDRAYRDTQGFVDAGDDEELGREVFADFPSHVAEALKEEHKLGPKLAVEEVPGKYPGEVKYKVGNQYFNDKATADSLVSEDQARSKDLRVLISKLEKANSGPESVDQIMQIKGKQNAAPVAKYLPYVQDFVKSGKWGRVGDLENARLNHISDSTSVGPLRIDPGYYTDDELVGLAKKGNANATPAGIQQWVDMVKRRGRVGFASGGPVHGEPVHGEPAVRSQFEAAMLAARR